MQHKGDPLPFGKEGFLLIKKSKGVPLPPPRRPGAAIEPLHTSPERRSEAYEGRWTKSAYKFAYKKERDYNKRGEFLQKNNF
jgi:hypothetical protein